MLMIVVNKLAKALFEGSDRGKTGPFIEDAANEETKPALDLV